MSTRCTIWYDEKMHLFSECFDDTIWLEIRQEFSTVTLPLPQAMLKKMLESGTVQEFAERGPYDWSDKPLPAPPKEEPK